MLIFKAGKSFLFSYTHAYYSKVNSHITKLLNFKINNLAWYNYKNYLKLLQKTQLTAPCHA